MTRGGGDNLTPAHCFDVHTRVEKSPSVSLARLAVSHAGPGGICYLHNTTEREKKKNKKWSRSSCQHEHRAISPPLHLSASPQTSFFPSVAFDFFGPYTFFTPFPSTEVRVCDRLRVCVYCAVAARARRARVRRGKVLNGSGHR